MLFNPSRGTSDARSCRPLPKRLDPHLLQLIRREMAVLADRSVMPIGMSRLEPAELQRYIERLYFGGELAGQCVLEGDSVRVTITGLTPYGCYEMLAHEARRRGEPEN